MPWVANRRIRVDGRWYEPGQEVPADNWRNRRAMESIGLIAWRDGTAPTRSSPQAQPSEAATDAVPSDSSSEAPKPAGKSGRRRRRRKLDDGAGDGGQ